MLKDPEKLMRLIRFNSLPKAMKREIVLLEEKEYWDGEKARLRDEVSAEVGYENFCEGIEKGMDLLFTEIKGAVKSQRVHRIVKALISKIEEKGNY